MRSYTPKLIAWEMTTDCGLSCVHCRIGRETYQNEPLSTDEGKKLLDSIASKYKPIIIMTGGDPLLREDFLELAEYGTSLGLKMVVASCGYGITPELVNKMQTAGIMAVSLSIDGADEKTHDTFRQAPGSFKKIIEAAGILKLSGMPFQINTTITKLNSGSIDEIFELAKGLGAKQFHPFLFVPTGKGKDIAKYSLTAFEYEIILKHIYELSLKNSDILIKPTCAPQYNRIILEHDPDNTRVSQGCMGGKSFAFISSFGEVRICGFLDMPAGNIRDHKYDFNDIWDHSHLFNSLRYPENFKGKCGLCMYHTVCSGCRARAYEVQTDYLGDEPFCEYVPQF
ncbi:MAG: radical SAM protein [Candidatus Omnitrophica bacterium]|nr:radical SAM protein [Candidatus Omnitrophota bacterium]